MELKEELNKLEQSLKIKDDELDTFRNKYNTLLKKRDSLDDALKEAKLNDQLTISKLQKELNDLKIKPSSSSSSSSNQPMSIEYQNEKLKLEKDYAEEQNIELKDTLIEREKELNQLRSVLSSIESLDEESAKQQVMELQRERILAAEKMYAISKKLEKAKAVRKKKEIKIHG
jgi:hypothetical protein